MKLPAACCGGIIAELRHSKTRLRLMGYGAVRLAILSGRSLRRRPIIPVASYRVFWRRRIKAERKACAKGAGVSRLYSPNLKSFYTMTQKYKTLEDLSKIISLFRDMTVEELSVTEISRKLAMSPSKVSRMLKTLEAEEFFAQNVNNAKYSLGFRFFELGLAYAFHLPLRKIIRPHIESLSQELKVTASWGIINQGKVIVVDRIQIMGLDTLAHRIGTNMPVHSTSIGKVLLANLSKGELSKVLRSTQLVKYTKKTVIDPKLIRMNLNIVREKGYAFDDGETAEDIVCVAAPIKDSNGMVIAAINLTDNVAHTKPDRMLGYAPLLKERALFISRQLGYEADFFQERLH